MNQIYMNPHAQDRQVVARLFGRSAGNRHSRLWSPHSALVYDFYEIALATDFDRAVQHCQTYPSSVIVLNFSHESMPSDFAQAQEADTVRRLYSQIDPAQLIMLCSQEDTIRSIQTLYPGVGTMHINYWEIHIEANRPPGFVAPPSRARLGSFNRRYTAPRALFLYYMRNHLHHMHYTFGERGYWDTRPSTVHQGEELKILRGWDPELAHRVEQWQQEQRPWRVQGDPAHWDDPAMYTAAAGADHWAVIESRAHNTQRTHSSFLTEKTFRAVAVGRAVYPVAEGNVDATLRNLGYEPYWNTPPLPPAERIAALAQHFEYLAQLSEPEYQRHQQAVQELVQHNSTVYRRRLSSADRRSRAPDRLKPYFG